MDVLIVGAGPVGLSCALFATRLGYKVQIVDRRIEPVKQSKALAVNPRTLELLEATGVTEQMLTFGMKVHGAKMWREDGTLLAHMPLEDLKTKYPFMLALSQAVTERLLTEALKQLGVTIERGQEVVSCANAPESVQIDFADGSSRRAKYLFAADGAHSVLRERLKIPFEGDSFPEDWYLADVKLQTDLPFDQANIVFLDGKGFYFLLPVIEDARRLAKDDIVWRVLSTKPDFLKTFKLGTPTAKPIWESNFHVSHRICHTLRVGSIFFAGDAAHLHSPVGARGMNLGIEDAFVFAKLLHEDRLQDYDEERREVDQKVVRRIDALSRVAVGDHALQRAFRQHVLPNLFGFGFVKNAMAQTMTGTDHTI